MNDFTEGADGLPIRTTATAAAGFGLRMVGFAAIGGGILATAVALAILSGGRTTEMETTVASLGRAGPLADVMLFGLSFVLTAVFTVFFHRRVMLGAAVASRPWLGGRELRFLAATVIYSLVIGVPAMAMTFLGGVAGAGADLPALGIAGVAVGVAIVLFLFVRFALAFPAIAVDAPGSLAAQFRYSFQATRGRFWRLLAIYLLAYVIFMVLAVAVSLAMGGVVAVVGGLGASPLALAWLAVTVQGSLQFVALAMFASIASRAFIAWAGWTPPAGGTGDPDVPLA